MIPRVIATPAARELVDRLRTAHGSIVFYQSHGCCEGSTPMCFAPGEMPLTADDRQLGDIDGVPFHASRAQCEYLGGTQITLDVAPGDAGTFSLEDGTGRHFVVRLRLWTDEEAAVLSSQSLQPSTAPHPPG
jgi:uncharacterized protein (DUF779 family)